MARIYQWVAVDGTEEPFIGKRILLQHYGDDKIRTRVLEADEICGADHWRLASLLNSAYEAGRTHAMEELRNLIGIK
jgi:hypothetical protein